MLNFFSKSIGVKEKGGPDLADSFCQPVCRDSSVECSIFQQHWYYLVCRDGSENFQECC
jgi:hypothetical protein